MPEPKIKVGGDARELAARSLRALGDANDRLTSDRQFYDDVRGQIGEARQ